MSYYPEQGAGSLLLEVTNFLRLQGSPLQGAAIKVWGFPSADAHVLGSTPGGGATDDMTQIKVFGNRVNRPIAQEGHVRCELMTAWPTCPPPLLRPRRY